MKKPIIVLALLISIAIIAALYLTGPLKVEQQQEAVPAKILLYTPPILVRLVNEVSEIYQRDTNVSVETVIGPTGTLMIKLETHQEGDIFATADSDFMRKAIDKGLVSPESVRVISLGIPVIIVPIGNPANVTSLEDFLTKDIKIGIADTEVAPFGRIAKEMLERKGIFDALGDKLQIYPDIGTLANQVRFGTVQAAILPHYVKYWYPNEVDIVWLPSKDISRIPCQQIGITRFTKSYDLSQRFIDTFLSYIKKDDVIQRYGLISSLSDVPKIAPYRPEDISGLIEKGCTGS